MFVRLTSTILTGVFLPLCLSAVAIRPARGEGNESSRHVVPDQFISVDTGRVMGSPDPLPLEAVPAFPELEFERPVELTFADDGSERIFVVEQAGVIHVFEKNRETESTKVFLDIREKVSRDGNEEGLLGLAFHPDYRNNGEFLVYYSTRPRASVLSRFRVSENDADRADPDSEEELMRIDQPFANHNGGSIRFGSDGYLYVGLGDGGAADDPRMHAQNLTTLLGSILRIDVDNPQGDDEYGIPEDNPFAGREDARGEIWAYGLRNVWRMAFDPETDVLWAADVGQDRVEEINVIRPGGNYGWNFREGFQPFEPIRGQKPSDLIDPLVEYSREDGQSVTGGLVYRGDKLKGFDGAYFYGDYLSGNVWIVRWDGSKVTEDRLVACTGLEIAAFGEDFDRDMYLCAFDGKIYELRPREGDLEEQAEQFPRRLSETGFFESVADHVPVAGLVPYEVNVPFWSDYTFKDRYIALPEKASVEFDTREKWKFPVGTVFVKTFWMHRDRERMKDPVRLETRLLVHSPRGWEGYTYVYGDEQSEAYLLDGSLVKPIEIHTGEGDFTQPYYFPSRSECRACHTEQEDFVLGLTTRQMNRTQTYRGHEEHQIELWRRLQMFSDEPDEDEWQEERFPEWKFGNYDRSGESLKTSAEPVEAVEIDDKDSAWVSSAARAWLEVNCAVCHRPDGIAPHQRDFRFHIPVKEMNLVGESPSQGQLGPPESELIKPGNPLESELFFRISRRGTRQMPPLASYQTDPLGREVIRRWLESLSAEDVADSQAAGGQ